MAWASEYIVKLQAGQTVSFRPHGNSMSGKIESGQLCTVEPIKNLIEKNDVVLCKVSGKEYLHLVKDVHGERYLIGNNKGGLNGWVSKNSIFGKLIKIEK